MMSNWETLTANLGLGAAAGDNESGKKGSENELDGARQVHS